MQDSVAMPMDTVAAGFMEPAGVDLLACWDRHQDVSDARRAALAGRAAATSHHSTEGTPQCMP